MAALSGALTAPAHYRYDAENVLVSTGTASRPQWRYWRGNAVVNATGGDDDLSWTYCAGQRVATKRSGIGGEPIATLLATDGSGSVVMEADLAVRNQGYTPYGYLPSERTELQPAYNGELLDNPSGCYLLGAGHHRPYSPTLQCFLAPDALSPFEEGGVNAYAYCAGDPINRTDPSGHLWKWLIAGLGVILSVASLGTLAAPLLTGSVALTASTVVGAIAGVVSVATEAASIVLEATGHEKAANILGWVGFAYSYAGMATALPALAKTGGRGLTRLGKLSKSAGLKPSKNPTGGRHTGGYLSMRDGSEYVFELPFDDLPTIARKPGKQPAKPQRTVAPRLYNDLEAEARETLEHIRNGGLPKRYPQDGAVYKNRSGYLPQAKKNHYLEYTVPTPGAFDRDGRRLVLGGLTAKGPENVYYSPDHYVTFKRVIFHDQMDDWYPYPRPT